MKNDLSRLACGVVLCFFLSAPVLAEIDDMSTTTCKEFNAQKSMDLLYWMAGFHATEAQGTVVDKRSSGPPSIKRLPTAPRTLATPS